MVHFTPHHPNERQEMLKTVEQAFFNQMPVEMMSSWILGVRNIIGNLMYLR
jgi:hypothetical protein